MTLTIEALFDTHADFRTYAETSEHYAYSLPDNALTFGSWEEMHRRISGATHYFDPSAVRFFRGRSDRQMIGGRFWVESKKYTNNMTGESGARTYSVAWVTDYNGNLSVEKWGEFGSLETARRWARKFAEAIA